MRKKLKQCEHKLLCLKSLYELNVPESPPGWRVIRVPVFGGQNGKAQGVTPSGQDQVTNSLHHLNWIGPGTVTLSASSGATVHAPGDIQVGFGIGVQNCCALWGSISRKGSYPFSNAARKDHQENQEKGKGRGEEEHEM